MKRIEYFISNIENVLKKREMQRELFNKSLNKKSVVIFGAGICGKNLYYQLSNYTKVKFFCDNDVKKCGEEIIDGIKCISVSELSKLEESVIFISSARYSKDIYMQLKSMGIKNLIIGHNWIFNEIICMENFVFADMENKIKQTFDLLVDKKSKDVFCTRLLGVVSFNSVDNDYIFYDDIYTENQYFVDEIIKIEEDAHIIDCGAYDGDTLDQFLRLGKNFGKYTCIEMNKISYKRLTDKIKSSKIDAIRFGISNESKEINYLFDKETSSSITDLSGNDVVKIEKLDNLFINNKVDLIKMDIEGAEVKALQGGEFLIKNNCPQLAICVYHRLSDLWEIPVMIHNMVPKYKLYLRHHMNTFTETVCYAIKS